MAKNEEEKNKKCCNSTCSCAENFQKGLEREIDEELEKENLKKLWNKYKTLIISIIIIIIVSTSSFVIYKNTKMEQEQASADLYLSAIKSSNPQDMISSLEEALPNLKGGYKQIASLQIAALKLQVNKEEGLSALKSIMDNKKFNEEYRNLARIQYIGQLINEGDVNELKSALEPLLKGENSWQGVALELRANIALREKDEAEAKKYLEQIISSSNISPTEKKRASEILTILGAKEGTSK